MMKKILYLTDLAYPAKGRDYGAEDVYITNRLKDCFDVALCLPKCAEGFEDNADLIVFRNTGSVLGFESVYRAFVRRVRQKHLRTFNTFDGKADMCAKQYLLDLTRENYPVIPTVDAVEKVPLLPCAERYVLKPKDGADSIGLEFVTGEQLAARVPNDGRTLIQPAVDFQYEVSFYFINDTFQYALYAPDKAKRWQLQPYTCSRADMEFAETFIRWNSLSHGIQRVDACRTKDGRLLLVELEDLNPYLSVLELDAQTRERFMQHFIHALHQQLDIG